MPSRDDAIAGVTEYFDGGAFEEELGRRVAIPSESQTPEGLPHCRRYLDDEMVPAFRAMGFETRIFENPVESAGPVLLATRTEDPALATVLGYGHGDVIRGLDDQWTKGAGPWAIAREGDRLYGRGTADNKGQHTVNMAALAAVLRARGRLGFNAKFMIETGEENGSAGVADIVRTNRDAFAADVLIASDGPRVRPDRPTLCLGARGAANFELVCDLREGGHHSGNWGGALADPAAILAHAIATIVGPAGEIRVPEWRPKALPETWRAALAGIELGDADGPGVDPGWGEPDLSPAERVFGWNSFAVLAMLSGNPASPLNAIAPRARAHCQLRYIAGTDAADIVPALRRHLEAHGQTRVAVNPPPPENAGGFKASRTEMDAPWAAWTRAALARAADGPPTVIPQMGGSICNEVFTDILGIPAVWIPHSYRGCSQHAPDEHLLMPMSREALVMMAGLYWDIGDSRAPHP